LPYNISDKALGVSSSSQLEVHDGRRRICRSERHPAAVGRLWNRACL